MSAQSLQTEVDEFLPERKEWNLTQKLGEVVATANDLAVTNEVNFKRITSMYAQAKDWEKQIEFARKAANAPDQDRINLRNDKAKELLTPLKQIQAIAKDKCAKYQEMLEDLKRQEEEKIKQAVAVLELDDMPYIPPAEKSHRGDGAIAYTRQVYRTKIVDLSKVPLKYLKIDQDAVDQAVDLGIREIPGIEIYQEKVTTLKSR